MRQSSFSIIYPIEIEIKDTTYTDWSASFEKEETNWQKYSLVGSLCIFLSMRNTGNGGHRTTKGQKFT